MLKKIIFCLSLITGITSLSAQDSVKIGFSLGDFSSDRWGLEAEIFTKKANALGAKVMIEFAYGDPKQQIEQSEKMIASGVKVLVIAPNDAEKCAEIVNIAHKSGVKVIAYDRMIRNADVDYYLSFDNMMVGEQQAQYAVDHHPEGNYVILGGPTSDNNSILFMKGELKVLKPYVDKGAIKIILQKHLADWNSIDAFNEIQSLLDSGVKNISAIITANDELASGAIMALDMNNADSNIIITGQDASLGGCQNIIDGKQSMTVYKPFPRLAKMAADLALELSKGGKITETTTSLNNGYKDVPSIIMNSVVVDKSNIRKVVVDSGFIKKDQLNFH